MNPINNDYWGVQVAVEHLELVQVAEAVGEMTLEADTLNLEHRDAVLAINRLAAHAIPVAHGARLGLPLRHVRIGVGVHFLTELKHRGTVPTVVITFLPRPGLLAIIGCKTLTNQDGAAQ